MKHFGSWERSIFLYRMMEAKLKKKTSDNIFFITIASNQKHSSMYDYIKLEV